MCLLRFNNNIGNPITKVKNGLFYGFPISPKDVLIFLFTFLARSITSSGLNLPCFTHLFLPVLTLLTNAHLDDWLVAAVLAGAGDSPSGDTRPYTHRAARCPGEVTPQLPDRVCGRHSSRGLLTRSGYQLSLLGSNLSKQVLPPVYLLWNFYMAPPNWKWNLLIWNDNDRCVHNEGFNIK